MNNWTIVSFHKAQKHSTILNEGQSLTELTVTGTTARLREAHSPAMWYLPDWSQTVLKVWNRGVKMVIPKDQNPQHQGYTVRWTLKQRKGYFDTVYSILLDQNVIQHINNAHQIHKHHSFIFWHHLHHLQGALQHSCS